MSASPGSYLTIDPGRLMGWACCLPGGANLRYGTWKFKQRDAGEVYADYLAKLAEKIRELPDVQVGMELMTIVPHVDAAGKASVDAQQVEFSAGWPTHAKTKCFLMRARPPEMIAISAWRSRTHGKTRAPQGAKNGWLKQKAFDYCHAHGWEPDSDNAAEALCMLDYLRILYEPNFAFDRGQSFQQEGLFA